MPKRTHRAFRLLFVCQSELTELFAELSEMGAELSEFSRGRHGGVEKRGGRKTSRMTPLPKRGFGPPSYGTFSTPLRCQCSVFLYKKIHDRADQKLFWRGPKIFGRARSLERFPPPIRFAPPISPPKFSFFETVLSKQYSARFLFSVLLHVSAVLAARFLFWVRFLKIGSSSFSLTEKGMETLKKATVSLSLSLSRHRILGKGKGKRTK